MSRCSATGAARPGGGAGAAALRARIEAEGFAGLSGLEAYRAYMRHLRSRAPNDLPAIGGRAAHRALLAKLGEDGYRTRQRAAFLAACAKHGEERIRSHIRRAHTERRLWRLEHPTPAEAALRQTLQALGYTVHPSTYQNGEQGFTYQRWLRDSCPSLSPNQIIFEAQAGSYFLDSLIPTLRLAIEADGGVHELRPQHDARRRAWLQHAGISLLSFQNEQVLAEGFRHILSEHIQQRIKDHLCPAC